MTLDSRSKPSLLGSAAPSQVPLPRRPTVHSKDLLAGERELVIRHGADDYRLRLTSNNKLILTK